MKGSPFLTGFLPCAFRVLLAAALMLGVLGLSPAPAARAASLTVNSAADTAANDGQCTLREAITNANNDDQSGSTDCAAGSGPDTITFSLPLSSTITLSSSLPDLITGTLTIDGATAPGLTISGGNVAGRRPFNITSGAIVTLSGLTIAQMIGESAIQNSGALTLNDNVVRDNIKSGFGPGLWQTSGTLVVNNTTFYNNQTLNASGGGVYIASGTTTLNNTTIYSNTAANFGGGLHVSGGAVTLNNSTVYGNTAGDGGGLYWTGNTLTLNNSTLSGNSGRTNGGGLYFGAGTATLNNSTVSNNTADGDGGGIYRSVGLAINLQNTILANNSDVGSQAPDCSGTLTSLGYNLIKSTAGCTFTATTGDLTLVDPLLGPLADNGGPTLTHALLPGSLAIDKIPFAVNGCGTAPDQRGVPRPQPQGTIYSCDIGAYEFAYGPGGVTKTGFVYALRDIFMSGNLIYGFEVNGLTGGLTALAGFPVPTGGLGTGTGTTGRMTYDAANARLYVINNGSDTVSAYAVNTATGALTALPFSPISLPSAILLWTCVVVHPSGSPLVVGDGGGTLASFNITASSATPAAGSPYSTSIFPASCAFSRDGAYLYLGGGATNNVAGLSVNASTGVLTALLGSPFDTGAATPVALATDTAGRLFLANFSANQVRAFTTSAGVPSPVSGNPFTSSLTQAVHGVWHPAGFYMVADRMGDRVGVYQIAGSGASTTLTAVNGSPFASGGAWTTILALDQTGAFLFAANSDSRNLTSFGVNPGNGALVSLTQPVDTLGTSGGITGLAFVPLVHRLYVPLIMK